jgi:hypothetical protein
MRRMALKEQLAAWQEAGLVDAQTAARIEAFESVRRPVGEPGGGISVGEVVAYIGAVILLVGVGFLYGTQYQAMGSAGRLVILGLVVAAGLAAGELIRLSGALGAGRRARVAGWSVAALTATAWFAQLFVDLHILTRPSVYNYPGASDDTSGSIALAAGIGFLIAVALLWRAGAGLLAFVAACLAYTSVAAFDTYLRTEPAAWSAEATWLLPGVILAVLAEALTRGPDRRWAREVLRFAALLAPACAALGFSNLPDGAALELFAGSLALSAFGFAYLRGSAGFAISGGVALFIVVNEVGFRHFAQSLGFPVVLIVSGITLLVVAGSLFRLLPRLRRPGPAPAPAGPHAG